MTNVTYLMDLSVDIKNARIYVVKSAVQADITEALSTHERGLILDKALEEEYRQDAERKAYGEE
jgi:hypothetical protein